MTIEIEQLKTKLRVNGLFDIADILIDIQDRMETKQDFINWMMSDIADRQAALNLAV